MDGLGSAESDTVLATEILSNRDTSRPSDQRRLDSRDVQTEQVHEQVANHVPGAGEAGSVGRETLADERPDPDGRGASRGGANP